MNDEDREALADMLVRCGIERGVLGRIDADNVARILLPVVEAIARRRAAEELEGWARSFRRCGQMGLRRDSRRVFPQVADVLEEGARDLRAETAQERPGIAVSADLRGQTASAGLRTCAEREGNNVTNETRSE